MRQAIHQPLFMTHVIIFGFATALLSLFQPLPTASAQQLTGTVSQTTDGTVAQGRRIENVAPALSYLTKSSEKKDTQNLSLKPHRLIRTPRNAPIASVEPSPSDSSPASSVPAHPQTPQSDIVTSQPKEPSSLNRSVGAAAPLATMTVVPLPATATGSITAGAAPTGTLPLAAASTSKSSTSGNGNAGGRSMSRLAAEMPGLAQLITPPSTPAAPVVPVPPAIGASPTSFSFTATQGGNNPAAQTLSISNTGGGTLTWTASEPATWLTLSPTGGTGNGPVTLTAATAGLTVGTQTATITLSAPGATTVTVPVSFTVTAAPTINLSPSSLSYAATQGAANPINQNISLTNSGGTLNWTISDDAPWLAVSPASGSGSSTLTTSVNTAGLTAGTYNGTLTVSAVGAASKTVAVTLTVSAPTTSSATLTWNANTESDLAGYKIYRATTSGVYGAPIATLQGNVTTYIAAGLQVGTTYFFVITAYDSAGNESPRSNEVSRSIF
jgi:hypothetical protein